MTTTLRPLGPEQHGPGGLRTRSYAVCVNSRPVGAIDIGTDGGGAGVARIRRLRIDPPDRRRGRGAIAVLAAEEVLRSWGCRRVETAVPATAAAALRLARALGYVEFRRILAKPVPNEPPVLPDGTGDRPMTEDEYPAWLETVKQRRARNRIDQGLTEEQAHAASEADHRAALPDGLATAGTLLRVLTHRGTEVGTLWLALRHAGPEGSGGHVHDAHVHPGCHGQGHGRSLLLLAESECQAARVPCIGFHVTTGDTAAQQLCDSLGYQPTRYHLFKSLL